MNAAERKVLEAIRDAKVMGSRNAADLLREASSALQIISADGRWLAEVDDLTEARAACGQLADDGEALPLRVEHGGRFSATFDADRGFQVHQVIA